LYVYCCRQRACSRNKCRGVGQKTFELILFQLQMLEKSSHWMRWPWTEGRKWILFYMDCFVVWNRRRKQIKTFHYFLQHKK
jgi:hypothetical protein